MVHVSYPYHDCLESRPKVENSCWMEHGKNFCNIFVTNIHRKKIPGFASKKTKLSHFKHVFVSYTSYLVQSIFKQKFYCLLKLISKIIPKKTRFFVLARPSYSIEGKSTQPFLRNWNLWKWIPKCLGFPMIPNYCCFEQNLIFTLRMTFSSWNCPEPQVSCHRFHLTYTFNITFRFARKCCSTINTPFIQNTDY